MNRPPPRRTFLDALRGRGVPELKQRLAPCLLALLLAACAAPEKRHSPAELQAYRSADFSWPAAAQRAELSMLALERERLPQRLADPTQLPAALAAIMLFNIEIDAGRAPLLAALPALSAQPAERQRLLLTAAHTLYAADAAPLLWPLLSKLAGPREFSIAAYTLLKADAAAAPALREALRQRADCCDEPRLQALQAALDPAAASEPPLAELLAVPLKPGLPVVFSLQRPGRRAMGLALLRGADGRFVRDADGQLLQIPQLALARSGLPGTITAGNTPRGLFTVRGAGTAGNRWIGPTPYLHSMLPIESSLAEFRHEAEQGQRWSEAAYDALLPASWRVPLREAWLAGLAGRDDILMHGTTINPAYYRGEPYFPGTPSAGCLVAAEQWSETDGRLLASDQLRLVQAFSADGHDRGFLIVAELPGVGAVSLDEQLESAVRAAEHQMLEARKPSMATQGSPR
ncbi:hypothetical protein [Roseateles violae]|uniref:Uncharacterized protein n=1 Tax=Roseateles violae TaxID=3058042 RepID=A0ABT8DPP7_9BURK|nr:hypothetical protein [Pelomonas sp. PFR6]MDN3920315.1 hypothetical protein [Pelomonas sp. PFR6]